MQGYDVPRVGPFSGLSRLNTSSASWSFNGTVVLPWWKRKLSELNSLKEKGNHSSRVPIQRQEGRIIRKNPLTSFNPFLVWLTLKTCLKLPRLTKCQFDYSILYRRELPVDDPIRQDPCANQFVRRFLFSAWICDPGHEVRATKPAIHKRHMARSLRFFTIIKKTPDQKQKKRSSIKRSLFSNMLFKLKS